MDFTYDELYEIRILLKESLLRDTTLTDEDKTTQLTALKKCMFKLKVKTMEEEILKKNTSDIIDTLKLLSQ